MSTASSVASGASKDRAPGPALTAALVAVTAAVVASAVAMGVSAVLVHRYGAQRAAATATASGKVIQDRLGEYDDIRVRWTDGAGHEHTQRFAIYDVDRYVEGSTFGVRYDPRHPANDAFAADSAETSAQDDLWVPTGFGVLLALLLVGCWIARGALFRLAVRRPRVAASAVAFAVVKDGTAAFALGDTTWLRLRLVDGERRWQRVMWHPDLHGLTRDVGPEGEAPVAVRGRTSRCGRLAVELPSGSRLVPIGRARRKAPASDSALPLSARVTLDQAVWWPPGLPRTAGGRGRSTHVRRVSALSFLITLGVVALLAPWAALPSAAGVAALAVNVWGLRGAQP